MKDLTVFRLYGCCFFVSKQEKFKLKSGKYAPTLHSNMKTKITIFMVW